MDSEQLCQLISNELNDHNFQPVFCFPCTITQDAPIHSAFLQLTLKDTSLRYIIKASNLKQQVTQTLRTLQDIKSASPLGCVPILHTFMNNETLFTIMPKGVENFETFLKRRERLSDQKLIDLLLQVTLGVASLHVAGFCHGDIHPSNFIIFEKQKVKLAKLNHALPFLQFVPQETNQIEREFEQIKHDYSKARRYLHNDLQALGLTLIILILSSKRPYMKYESIGGNLENLIDILKQTQILKSEKKHKEELLKQALISLLSKYQQIDAVGMLQILMEQFYSQQQEQSFSTSLFGSLIEEVEKEEEQDSDAYFTQIQKESQNRLNLLHYQPLDLQKWFIGAVIKRTIYYKDKSGTLMEYKGAVMIEDMETAHGMGLLTTPKWTFQGLFIKGKWSKGRLVKITKQEYEGHFENDLPHGEGKQRLPGLFQEYKGSFKEGKRHGKGKMIWDEHTNYNGEFKDDLIQGEGTYECALFSVLNKSSFRQTGVGGVIKVSGTISSIEKLMPKMLKNFGQNFGIQLDGSVNFLYQNQNQFSCGYKNGRLISFYCYNRADRRSFAVLNEDQDEIDPSTLSGMMKMEWDYVEHHPSGLIGTHNCYYEGEVLNGKENGFGMKINKIDQTKYTG